MRGFAAKYPLLPPIKAGPLFPLPLISFKIPEKPKKRDTQTLTLAPISMATQSMIDSQREGAEIYTGHDLCKQKSSELLAELHLPSGLLPLSDLEEVGYNRSSGFVWLRQKKSLVHTFKKIGKATSYATEVTAFVEERRMKRLTGVKAKELLIWLTLCEFSIDEKDLTKINFKTPAGLSRTFPVSAFEEEETAAVAAA